MKRFLSLILALTLFCALTACGGQDAAGETPSADNGEENSYTVAEFLCLETWKEMNLGYTTLDFYEDGTGLIDNGYVSAETRWMVDENRTVTVQYDYGGVKTAVYSLVQQEGIWCLVSDSGTALFVPKSYETAAAEKLLGGEN